MREGRVCWLTYRPDNGRKETKMQETGRRELETMPFDINGMHATGYEVCHGDPSDLADWWLEYEDADGDPHYYR